MQFLPDPPGGLVATRFLGARGRDPVQALPEGRLDARVLFYRILLGLEPEAVIDLPDPYGLVHSKAMSNRERAVRFPLNISESRSTATARSVTNCAGAGVSHIAFSTSDIFSSAEAVKR